MNILLTGGAGFIGSNLVSFFLDQPIVDFVRVMDNLATGHLSNLEEFQGNRKFEFFNFPVGLGVNIRCTPRLNVNLNSTWLPSFDDQLDGYVGGNNWEQLWEHRFGLSYNFNVKTGKNKEGDKKDEKAKEKPAKEKKAKKSDKSPATDVTK